MAPLLVWLLRLGFKRKVGELRAAVNKSLDTSCLFLEVGIDEVDIRYRGRSEATITLDHLPELILVQS